MFFRRGDLPEPAPAILRGLGPAPGYTVKRFDSIPDLNAYARANGVTQGEAYTEKMFLGAVIPGKKEIALLKPGLLKDPQREDEIDHHEYGHTYGLEHHDGKGWLTKDGRNFNDFSAADQQAWVDRIRNPPPAAATYDWSQAFAKPAADPLVQALQAKPQPVTPQQPDPLLAAIQQAKNRPA